MSDPRTCPHFQTRLDETPHGLGRTLHSVRRCLLAERMVRLLKVAPGARTLAISLSIDAGAEPPLCILGPDLEPIDWTTCTADRCERSCTPSYQEVIGRFGLTDLAVVDCGPTAGSLHSAAAEVDCASAD